MKEFITVPQTEPAYLVPTDRRDQPKLLAELFCGLNSEGQAQFFDRIAEIDKEFWGGKGVFQWRHMQDESYSAEQMKTMLIETVLTPDLTQR